MSSRHRTSTRSSRLSTSKTGQAQGRAHRDSLLNQGHSLGSTTTPTSGPFSLAGPSASLSPDLSHGLSQEEYPLGPTTTPASAPYSLAGPTRTQTRPFSLAGPTASRTQSKRDDRTSFVTEEYLQHNPDHGKWSDEPIFALSKPFPRVMRPGMREKTPTHKEQRPSTNSTEAGQRAKDGTGDGHVGVANESQPQSSSVETATVGGDDVLRKATTANFSSYLPGILQTHEKELEDEQISAHDKAHSPESLQTQSRDAVSAARQRLQGIADAAPNDSGVRLPQNLDWEEYQQRPPPEYLHPYHISANAPSDLPHFFNSWGPMRYKFRKPFAEFLGTIVYMTIGLCGSITHMASAPSTDNASLLMAYLAWGFGVMMAIYIAGGVSGAHLNPTISIMLAIFRGFPWHDCWQYIIAQLLGSITASGIAYGLYRDAIAQYTRSKSISQAGPAFWTKPRDGLSNVAAFFNEFVATAIVSGSVLALGDDSNSPPADGMSALIIGLLSVALEMAFAYNTGTCLNPARDLGPRLVTWWAGFGTNVFTLCHYWFIWGSWVGPILGGLFGAVVYDTFIFIGGESPINYPYRRYERDDELRDAVESKEAGLV